MVRILGSAQARLLLHIACRGKPPRQYGQGPARRQPSGNRSGSASLDPYAGADGGSRGHGLALITFSVCLTLRAARVGGFFLWSNPGGRLWTDATHSGRPLLAGIAYLDSTRV